MKIKFGDLNINLYVEWRLWPSFHKDNVEFKVSRFRKGIRVINSYGDIAVIKVNPDSYFIRKLLVENRDFLRDILLSDWVRRYGERHVIIFKDGKWLSVLAYAYEPAEDCITYYYVVNNNAVDDKKVIPKDSILVVVDVKYGVPIYGSIFGGTKNEGEDS